jgi:hypothetical protein
MHHPHNNADPLSLSKLGLTTSVTSPVMVHQLQLAVLHEINLLNQPRQGILELEVDMPLPLMPLLPCFAKQDICSVIHNNRLSKALIYFLPKYTLDKNGR